jgi:hypothetical protein
MVPKLFFTSSSLGKSRGFAGVSFGAVTLRRGLYCLAMGCLRGERRGFCAREREAVVKGEGTKLLAIAAQRARLGRSPAVMA